MLKRILIPPFIFSVPTHRLG